MWIIIFILILLILLIVILETWKRFHKKKDLEKKLREVDHTNNLLKIKSKILDLEKRKLEIEKSTIDPHDLNY